MVYRYGESNAWNSSKGPHVLEPFIFSIHNYGTLASLACGSFYVFAPSLVE